MSKKNISELKKQEQLEKIGENIKRIRAEKKITQIKLAQLSEIEKGNLSRIESGQNNITVVTLLRISRVLDVHLVELVRD